MTKEEEKAIKVLEKYKNECIEEYKVELDDKKNTDEQHASYLHQQIEAVYTVLNMLKEKDAEIEKYKNLLASNLARNLNDSLKAKDKADADLEYLNIGWQLELEKKDKMIDLMAEELQKHIFVLYDGDTITSKKGIIEHYEREAANDG